MTISDAYRLTISEAEHAIRDGHLRPSELTESCIGRADYCEDAVQAWACLSKDEARMDARLRDAHPGTGPLYGIPFGVKDIIEVADLPIGYGTPIYRNHVSSRDAACVALLKEAGAVCLGKTVTTELAHFHPGKTRNPHGLSHTPGGSSSGSAAAVAAGTVPFALGTQTTGSVLRPAAFCGVFGFKPSFGDVNRSGVMECASSFDTVGWFTRCVDDIEIVRRGLIRLPHEPLKDVQISDLRIGLYRGPDWNEADDCTRALITDAVDSLARAGLQILPVETPQGFSELHQHHRTIAGFEFARAITWERTARSTELSPKLLEGRCGDGLRSTYAEYASAQDALTKARQTFADAMQACDALLTPVAKGAAPEGLTATGEPVFNTAWTALHVPAISIPAFKNAAGMPIGLQMVGQFRRDAKLLAAAKAISRALDVEVVRPVPAV